MEFLTGLFIIFILAAIFGPKKGKRKRRSASAARRRSAGRPARRVETKSSGTRNRRPSETERLLREAMKTGEVLTVSYAGGTQPGATRRIHPLRFHHDKVRAYCYSSNAEKDFFVDKMSVQPDGAEASYEDLGANGSLNSVEAFKAEYMPAFQSRGWTIEHGDNYIKLFDHFKNMKPRKTPALSLLYEPTYTEIDWLSDDESEVVHQRKRPWCVSTRKGSSQFSNLQQALAKFVMLERDVSPFRE